MEPSIAIYVALGLIFVFALGLAVPRRPREVLSPVTDTKLDAIHTRMSELERKQVANDHDVRGIKMAMQGAATIASVHKLELKVMELGGKVESVSTNIATISNGVDRIESFLMQATAEAIATKITEAPK